MKTRMIALILLLTFYLSSCTWFGSRKVPPQPYKVDLNVEILTPRIKKSDVAVIKVTMANANPEYITPWVGKLNIECYDMDIILADGSSYEGECVIEYPDFGRSIDTYYEEIKFVHKGTSNSSSGRIIFVLTLEDDGNICGSNSRVIDYKLIEGEFIQFS